MGCLMKSDRDDRRQQPDRNGIHHGNAVAIVVGRWARLFSMGIWGLFQNVLTAVVRQKLSDQHALMTADFQVKLRIKTDIAGFFQ